MLLTPSDVAAELAISQTQARALMRRLPCVDVGIGKRKILRITRAALDEFIQRGTTAGMKPSVSKQAKAKPQTGRLIEYKY